jgi:murein DD-endopeptidase MepM/ murein hydrolase activator NlpD
MADHRLPIVSVAAGVITKTYVDSGKTHGAGNGWTIYSADTNITWKYFHMDDFAEGLEEGDAVEQGQVIGYVGNTGTSGALSDRNYHLHFEYRPGNVARDSYSMLERAENVTFY